MTNHERKQIEEILNFLKEKKDINSYEVKDNEIEICTEEKDKKEIEFLKFRIISAISIINEEFEEKIDIDIKAM